VKNNTGGSALVSAFTEEQVERIAGVTKSQLRYWDKTGFFSPTEFEVYKGQAFGRVYSFRDLASLKILNDLRNKAEVPLQLLRGLKTSWDSEDDDLWISHTLFAVNKRVAVDTTRGLEDALSGQKVMEIPIRAEYNRIKNNISKLFDRDKGTIGKIDRKRNISSNKPVIAGTRIKVKSIQAFAEAGYSINQILKEYPSLKKKDVQVAIRYKESA